MMNVKVMLQCQSNITQLTVVIKLTTKSCLDLDLLSHSGQQKKLKS